MEKTKEENLRNTIIQDMRERNLISEVEQLIRGASQCRCKLAIADALDECFEGKLVITNDKRDCVLYDDVRANFLNYYVMKSVHEGAILPNYSDLDILGWMAYRLWLRPLSFYVKQKSSVDTVEVKIAAVGVKFLGGSHMDKKNEIVDDTRVYGQQERVACGQIGVSNIEDDFNRYIKSNVVKTNRPDDFVTVGEMYDNFQRYCKEEHGTPSQYSHSDVLALICSRFSVKKKMLTQCRKYRASTRKIRLVCQGVRLSPHLNRRSNFHYCVSDDIFMGLDQR